MKTTLKELENLKTFIESLTGKKLKIDKNTAGYTVHVISNLGGIIELFHGRFSKNELYHIMHAFITGLEYARKERA